MTACICICVPLPAHPPTCSVLVCSPQVIVGNAAWRFGSYLSYCRNGAELDEMPLYMFDKVTGQMWSTSVIGVEVFTQGSKRGRGGAGWGRPLEGCDGTTLVRLCHKAVSRAAQERLVRMPYACTSALESRLKTCQVC